MKFYPSVCLLHISLSQETNRWPYKILFFLTVYILYDTVAWKSLQKVALILDKCNEVLLCEISINNFNFFMKIFIRIFIKVFTIFSISVKLKRNFVSWSIINMKCRRKYKSVHGNILFVSFPFLSKLKDL